MIKTKGRQKLWRMKMGNFLKGKFLKFSRKSKNFIENRGNLKHGGGMHHGLRGMDAPGGH